MHIVTEDVSRPIHLYTYDCATQIGGDVIAKSSLFGLLPHDDQQCAAEVRAETHEALSLVIVAD